MDSGSQQDAESPVADDDQRPRRQPSRLPKPAVLLIRGLYFFMTAGLVLSIIISISIDILGRRRVDSPKTSGNPTPERCASTVERLDAQLREEASQWLNRRSRRRQGEARLALENWALASASGWVLRLCCYLPMVG